MGQRSLGTIRTDLRNSTYLLGEHVRDAESWAESGYSDYWEYELESAQTQLNYFKELVKELFEERKKECDAFWAEVEKEEIDE